MYILMNVHALFVEGNFSDKSAHAIKTSCNKDHNAHVGCVDKSDKMVNSAKITQATWKWKKKSFPLTDMAILNAYDIQEFLGGSCSWFDHPITCSKCDS